MEQKGINTITNEIKNYLTDIVNTYLQQGVPSTIISLIVENIDYELKIDIFSDDLIRGPLL